jgi:YgiT-type zinc finger domain-containing protein
VDNKEIEQGWRELSEEVVVGMREWREQHPRATMREIEAALDERLARLRVRMLQDTALASRATDWRENEEPECCPECGGVLKPRGQQRRHLQTQGGQEVVLKREYGECSACGAGLFPPG